MWWLRRIATAPMPSAVGAAHRLVDCEPGRPDARQRVVASQIAAAPASATTSGVPIVVHLAVRRSPRHSRRGAPGHGCYGRRASPSTRPRRNGRRRLGRQAGSPSGRACRMRRQSARSIGFCTAPFSGFSLGALTR